MKVGVLTFPVLICVAGCSLSAAPTPVPTSPLRPVVATKPVAPEEIFIGVLHDSFDSNPVAAEDRIKGRSVKIWGEVMGISEVNGQLGVSLIEPEIEDPKYLTVVAFDQSFRKQIDQIQKNEYVKLTGTFWPEMYHDRGANPTYRKFTMLFFHGSAIEAPSEKPD